MKKGALITLYGINNIGKSTQARILSNKLQKSGYRSIWLKYPVKSLNPSGKYLDKILRNPKGQKVSEAELQLWFVINRHQFQPELESLLNEGYIVVAEDYIGTGIAWGMAKGLDEKWLIAANEHLIKEDLPILLQGKRYLHAMETHHIHERNPQLVEKSRKTHEHLAKKYGWQRVTVQEKKQDTAKEIWKVVDDFLRGR